jgi:hypothetical protein
MTKISSKEGWKMSVSLQNFDFIRFSHVFQPSFDDISAICWWILMQNSAKWLHDKNLH